MLEIGIVCTIALIAGGAVRTISAGTTLLPILRVVAGVGIAALAIFAFRLWQFVVTQHYAMLVGAAIEPTAILLFGSVSALSGWVIVGWCMLLTRTNKLGETP